MRMSGSKRVAARPTVTKRATNVSIRADLLAAARSAGLNLSATLERALADELAAERRRRWLEQNSEGVAAYNESVTRIGVFSSGRRKF
jgi:antitoxin CcdA